MHWDTDPAGCHRTPRHPAWLLGWHYPLGTPPMGGSFFPSHRAAIPKHHLPPRGGGSSPGTHQVHRLTSGWWVESWDPYLVPRHAKPLLSPCPTVTALTHLWQYFHLPGGRSSPGRFPRGRGTLSSPVELEGSVLPR